jgi:hypothetical protein
MANNVLTLGVIDLVEPGKRGIALNQIVARRRVGHYVGLRLGALLRAEGAAHRSANRLPGGEILGPGVVAQLREPARDGADREFRS